MPLSGNIAGKVDQPTPLGRLRHVRYTCENDDKILESHIEMTKTTITTGLAILLFLLSCKDETTAYLPESPKSHLRVINVFQRGSNIEVLVNGTKIVDSLVCNFSSGYVEIVDDSLNIEILDNNNDDALLYDTLCYLEKEKYYTLYILSINQTITSEIVKDLELSSQDCAFIRIFNNSEAGDPYIFSIISAQDTIVYPSLSLHQMSGYKIALDTLYTVGLTILSGDNLGAVGLLPVERNRQYTLVITDTFHITDAWWPYIVLIFNDIIDDQEFRRLHSN